MKLRAAPETSMTHVSNQKKDNVKRARVELDIFSGRPNPTWLLTGADTETLTTMIGKLVPEEPTASFNGLGYRGFIVTFPAPIAGITTVRVYKEIVRLDETNYRKDPGRTIEHWLLTKAKAALNEGDYQALAKDIEAIH